LVSPELAETPPIEIYDELESTNAEARRRAEAGEVGPVWIMAERQTAGRGRRGRAWSSGEGNLAATLLMTTDASPPKRPRPPSSRPSRPPTSPTPAWAQAPRA